MHVDEVPLILKELVATKDPALIAEALTEALGDAGEFRYYDTIQGGPFSGRMFFVNPEFKSIPLPQPDTESIAEELVAYIPHARYSYNNVSPGDERGWHISSVRLPNGDPAAIAWASWI